MKTARVRIGRVRFKSGGELRMLPSAAERTAATMFAAIGRAVSRTRELYGQDLAGYVLIPFNASGEHSVFVRTEALRPQNNDLPRWAEEAIRRATGEDDARRVVRRTLGWE